MSIRTLENTLEKAGFGCIAATVLVAPWMFGAWEMWWFWPFAVLIFVAALLFACRVLIRPGFLADRALMSDALPDPPARRLPESSNRRIVESTNRRINESTNQRINESSNQRIIESTSSLVRPRLSILLTCFVFLAYAFVRFLQADVFMDAERSFLLFFTPFLIGLLVVFGLNPDRRRVLFLVVLANFFLLGLYGVINHRLTGSALVLWADGFPQYVNDYRATGTYFCPDHFAGIMEIAFCMALALVMDRRSAAKWRICGVLLAILSVVCVLLSKSRGGGLTILIVGAAALCWGFSQWPSSVRWYLRGAVLTVALTGLVLLSSSDLAYVQRFKKYFRVKETAEMTLSARRAALTQKLLATSRGRMISGAFRAWKTRPVLGIGPGMHQSVWPRFAATGDGDREKGIWPTRPNYDFHSYEVHSDWVQLLEEYGVAGLVLFLVPAGLVFAALVSGRPREEQAELPNEAHAPLHAAPLTALLAFVCMAFHSLGDFNLQMPATTWVLAAVLALPFSMVTETGID